MSVSEKTKKLLKLIKETCQDMVKFGDSSRNLQKLKEISNGVEFYESHSITELLDVISKFGVEDTEEALGFINDLLQKSTKNFSYNISKISSFIAKTEVRNTNWMFDLAPANLLHLLLVLAGSSEINHRKHHIS